MAGDWPFQRLPDLLTLQRGHDLASDKRVDGKFPVIAATGQVGVHNEAKCEAPGVVIGRSGSIGGAQWIDEPFWPLNTTLYVIDFKGNNPYFCYSVLKSIDFQRFNAGSGVPTLNRNHLVDIKVPAISRSEQDGIANILFALEVKIDLNRQMAATLEEMARALFKSWFVDFDPVHAKAGGRDTGLAADIAALFPDSVDDEGLPTGWVLKRADEIARSVRSTANPQAMPPETPYVGLEHLPRKSLGIANHGHATQVESGKLYFKAGDLLFGKLRPYFHKVSVMPFEGIASSDIFVFRAKLGKYRGLMYFGFSDEKFVASASGASTGTRMPRADWSYMSEQQFASDEGQVLEVFNEFALSHVSQISERLEECRKLEQLRDTLLPKLLSGELRVADAESVIAAA